VLAAAALLALASCAHSPADPRAKAGSPSAAGTGATRRSTAPGEAGGETGALDPGPGAAALVADLRQLWKEESAAAWERWTGGTGPGPVAAGSGHGALFGRSALLTLERAVAASRDE
jgi:hypothetical protein